MHPMSTTNTSIQIFKTGAHIPMQGAALSFSESDLAATAAAYDPALHEAPLVIGHPRADGPAHGWVQSLGVAGGALEAVPHQVDAAFAEQVRAGAYKKISASFYMPDSPNNPAPGAYYLRHVGFLGAQPPAIKGLRPVSFADAETGIVEFGDFDDRVNAGLWRGLREWIIAKFGLDAADQALPGWNVDVLQESAAQPPETTVGSGPELTQFSEKTEVQVSPEEKAKLEAENAQLKKQVAQMNARDKAALEAQRHQANADFAEGLIDKRLLNPKNREIAVALLDLAATPDAKGQAVEFGEGDAAQPLLDAAKSMLADDVRPVSFGEQALKGRAGASSVNPLLADAESRAKNAK